MSEIARRLRELVPMLEEGRETHRVWAEDAFDEQIDAQPAVGDRSHHLNQITEYDKRIKAVTEAADYIEILRAKRDELVTSLMEAQRLYEDAEEEPCTCNYDDAACARCNAWSKATQTVEQALADAKGNAE